MATEVIGLFQRLANYASGGGTAANHFALGYSEAGRFGKSTAGRHPDWSKAERDAYNAGMKGRAEDKAKEFGQ